MPLPYANIDPTNPAFNPLTWYNLVGAVGCALWIAAYILIAKKSEKEKTYGFPLIAICLNIAWESLACFVWPNPVLLWKIFDHAWFLFDLWLVSQLVRFGRKEMVEPEIRDHFWKILFGIFVLAVAVQHSFVMTYFDRLGLVVAFVINFAISALFIPFYFARRNDRRGLSVPGAWCKMLGTLGTAVECHWLVRAIDPELPSLAFLTVISVAIFALDVVYLVLLIRLPSVQPSSSASIQAT
jgi:hypothetical protein